MIYGIGLDLCDIERMGHAVEKEHFLNRVFAAREAERIRGANGRRRAEIAAGLFAAKEAVAKALGSGFAGVATADIEVVPDDAGCPRCRLSGSAAARARALCGGDGWRVWVSVTHEGNMAAATAVLERAEPEERDYEECERP